MYTTTGGHESDYYDMKVLYYDMKVLYSAQEQHRRIRSPLPVNKQRAPELLLCMLPQHAPRKRAFGPGGGLLAVLAPPARGHASM